VLELLREEDARREVDQLAVVERDQRVRDQAARGVDDRQLADERGLEELFNRLGEHSHGTDDSEPRGGFDGTSLVVGVRWSFRGKDAGSLDSSAIGATEDAVLGASSAGRRHSWRFVEPS